MAYYTVIIDGKKFRVYASDPADAYIKAIAQSRK
jgi:hypothetical protein